MPVDYSVEIAEITDAINAGLDSTTVDGTSAAINLPFLRQRLAELQRLQDQGDQSNLARPRMLRVRLAN